MSNSSMGHQKWQPQVFLDIIVNSCLWYKCWVSESTLSRWWLSVALWNLTYGFYMEAKICQHSSCKFKGSQRSSGCHFWWPILELDTLFYLIVFILIMNVAKFFLYIYSDFAYCVNFGAFKFNSIVWNTIGDWVLKEILSLLMPGGHLLY